MPHATHFLQRLDRVSERQVELALALYRDDELLKTVLASVELPGEVERVAISLEHPMEGPFVVVTRTGRFVTCLGAGMRPNGLFVITRERFDIAAGRVQRMRDELDRVARLVEQGQVSELKRLMRTVETAGPRFCREDAELLAQVAPLLAYSIAERLHLMLTTLLKGLPTVSTMRIGKLSGWQRDGMLDYGRLAWAIAHTLPMLAVRETRQLWKLVGEEERARTEFMFTANTFDLYHVAFGHRALWTVARSGKGGIAQAREVPKDGSRPSRIAFRELTLAAIALATPSLHNQAVHKLSPELSADDPGATQSRQLAGYVAKHLRRGTLEAPEKAVENYTAIGREMVREVMRQEAGAAGEKLPDEALPPVPDDVARAAVANMTCSWNGSAETFACLHFMALSLPWLARAPLEELYLPRAWADRLLPPSRVDEVEAWLVPCLQARGLGRPQPVVRKEPKQARNGACTCGSGRKWKHCCALKTGVATRR